MKFEQAEQRLREIVNGSHGDQPLDKLLKTDTDDPGAVAECILNTIKMLKEDLKTADKTLKEECRRNAELKSLLHALMKYIIGGGDDAQEM